MITWKLILVLADVAAIVVVVAWALGSDRERFSDGGCGGGGE